MLQKLRHSKREQGFTIIEVLIVLAIAGLILLIVFLAVPALQRNSRNTQRKDDASAIMSGLNEYTDNNSGQLPTTGAAFTAALFSSSTSCSNSTGNVKLGFFTCGNVTYTYNATVPGTAPAPTANVDNVYVYSGVTCSSNAPTVTGASTRSIALVYWVETSGGNTQQCIGS